MSNQSEKIYCLYEDYEKLSGKSKSSLLAISTEKDLLRELMKAKVAADEFGLVAQKGVKYYDEDTFRTNSDYGFGYLDYEITEELNLSREALLKQIETERMKAKATFEETIWYFPGSKTIRLFLTECKDGDLDTPTLLSFLAECKEESGLTQDDIQTIKTNIKCQRAIYEALDIQFEKDEQTISEKDVRSYYSDERKSTLIGVITTAYTKYRETHPEA